LVAQNTTSKENGPKHVPQKVGNGHSCSTSKIANMHGPARIYKFP
jgi:hypothetical protein